MSRERDDRLDPSRPTLIVQTGNTRRKHRPLDRNVLVLGRAAGCDVGLEAPDVAPVHCVIVRAADGWHVRDCTGKGGTRVNGRSVYDAALADEDVLQVGSFSFALHLPPERRPPAAPDDPEASALRWQELDRRSAELNALQQDVDDRLTALKQDAQEVAAGKAGAEESRRALEASTADAHRGLDIRADELQRYALHLRRVRQRLNDHEESLTARWQGWLREQQEASVALERQRENVRRDEALLRDQRDEIVRLTAEMRQESEQPEGLVESPREASEAGPHRSQVELDAARSVLDEQVRAVQGRFAELERAARDAETHLAQGRERIAQGRQELERLRDGLWPAGETLVDAPSPICNILNDAPADAAPAGV